jgi:hypothetical protein
MVSTFSGALSPGASIGAESPRLVLQLGIALGSSRRLAFGLLTGDALVASFHRGHLLRPIDEIVIVPSEAFGQIREGRPDLGVKVQGGFGRDGFDVNALAVAGGDGQARDCILMVALG